MQKYNRTDDIVSQRLISKWTKRVRMGSMAHTTANTRETCMPEWAHTHTHRKGLDGLRERHFVSLFCQAIWNEMLRMRMWCTYIASIQTFANRGIPATYTSHLSVFFFKDAQTTCCHSIYITISIYSFRWGKSIWKHAMSNTGPY